VKLNPNQLNLLDYCWILANLPLNSVKGILEVRLGTAKIYGRGVDLSSCKIV
jgi:hypothetical protein